MTECGKMHQLDFVCVVHFQLFHCHIWKTVQQTMNIKFPTSIYIILIVEFYTVVFARNICNIQKHGKYGEFCENIYVWNTRANDFISLFNVSFGTTILPNDLNALKGTTIRVIADNVRGFSFNMCEKFPFSFLLFIFQMLPYITSSNYSQQLGGYLGDIWDIIQATLKFK